MMIFDSHYWFVAFLFSAICAALTFWLSLGSGISGRNEGGYASLAQAKNAAIIGFFIDLLFQRIDFYYFQPSITGSFFGYWTPLLVALLPAIVIGNVVTELNSKLRSFLLLGLIILVPTAQTLLFSFGPENTRAFAELPKITTAKATDTIPPTDEQHLVQVTEPMAEMSAKRILGNLSTSYAIGNFALQGIKGHRYYAAPLVPINSNDTFWTPLFGGRASSPGYVLVDAENKEATPQLKTGYHISLFEDQDFSMSLERFAYQAGFDKGSLDDATFEVDDNFEPHWTITYVTPAFGNIVGSTVNKVLVVDFPEGNPELHAYNPGDAQIKWVDRVISKTLVHEYADDWGLYGQSFSNANFSNWLQVWLRLTKQGTMQPAEGDEGLMLSYTKDDHNIWVVPMTSRTGNHGVLGILVFETDQNKGVYYPGLNGFNHGNSVSQTMEGAKDNGLQKYPIENLELYNIYGHLTWVAIYTRPQKTSSGDSAGSTAGAIGFMDARSQEASDVAYGTDLPSALSDYANKLANGSSGGMTATQANSTVSFSSTIWRIAPNGSTWRFQLNGDQNHYFDVTTQTFAGTPLLRDGDRVVGDFMDTHQPQVAVHSLKLIGNGPGAKTDK